MKRITIGLIAVLLGLHDGVASQQPEFETTEVGPGVYQFRFRSHNGFFVVTDGGVVAFDPISTEAAAAYAREIARVAPGVPLAAVVYSHNDADHATGAEVLREALGPGAPIVGHANSRQRLVEAGDPNLPPPTLTFDEQMVLHFGGRQIELHYLGRNHSDNSLVALLPEERVAFAVDFVSRDRMGYRDLPGFYFPDQFDSLHRLRALGFDTIVFGHGPPGDKAAVDRQIAYYNDLRTAVERAHARGVSEEEAMQTIRLPQYAGWDAYEDWFPLNVQAMYRWVAGRSSSP